MYSFERNDGIAVAQINTLGDNSIIGFISKAVVRIIKKLEENPEGFVKPLPKQLLILTFNDMRSNNVSMFEIDYVKEHCNIDVVVKSIEDGESMTFIDNIVEWK